MDPNHRSRTNESSEGRGNPTSSVDESGEGRRRRGNRHHAFRRKNRARDPREAQADSRQAPTSAEMRDARASGRAPGKTSAEEPAAVPLGTDDEAAGSGPSPASLQREVDRTAHGRGMQGLTAAEAMKGRPGHPEESARGFGKFVTIGAAVVILVVLAILFF